MTGQRQHGALLAGTADRQYSIPDADLTSAKLIHRRRTHQIALVDADKLPANFVLHLIQLSIEGVASSRRHTGHLSAV